MYTQSDDKNDDDNGDGKYLSYLSVCVCGFLLSLNEVKVWLKFWSKNKNIFLVEEKIPVCVCVCVCEETKYLINEINACHA